MTYAHTNISSPGGETSRRRTDKGAKRPVTLQTNLPQVNMVRVTSQTFGSLVDIVIALIHSFIHIRLLSVVKTQPNMN